MANWTFDPFQAEALLNRALTALSGGSYSEAGKLAHAAGEEIALCLEYEARIEAKKREMDGLAATVQTK